MQQNHTDVHTQTPRGESELKQGAAKRSRRDRGQRGRGAALLACKTGAARGENGAQFAQDPSISCLNNCRRTYHPLKARTFFFFNIKTQAKEGGGTAQVVERVPVSTHEIRGAILGTFSKNNVRRPNYHLPPKKTQAIQYSLLLKEKN